MRTEHFKLCARFTLSQIYELQQNWLLKTKIACLFDEISSKVDANYGGLTIHIHISSSDFGCPVHRFFSHNVEKCSIGGRKKGWRVSV